MSTVECKCGTEDDNLPIAVSLRFSGNHASAKVSGYVRVSCAKVTSRAARSVSNLRRIASGVRSSKGGRLGASVIIGPLRRTSRISGSAGGCEVSQDKMLRLGGAGSSGSVGVREIRLKPA